MPKLVVYFDFALGHDKGILERELASVKMKKDCHLIVAPETSCRIADVSYIGALQRTIDDYSVYSENGFPRFENYVNKYHIMWQASMVIDRPRRQLLQKCYLDAVMSIMFVTRQESGNKSIALRCPVVSVDPPPRYGMKTPDIIRVRVNIHSARTTTGEEYLPMTFGSCACSSYKQRLFNLIESSPKWKLVRIN